MMKTLQKTKDTLRIAILAALCIIGAKVTAEAQTLEFQGRIEAVHHAEVYSRAEGIVAEVLVSQGEYVEAGTPMVRLRQDMAELAVLAAEAGLAQSQALLTQAQGRLARAERLSVSGSASEVTLIEARTQLLLAQAALAADQTALTVAQTELDDTVIRAPISGYVEDPRVRVGALLEFNSGDPPLFHILDLDPVRLAYDVPYAERLSQIASTGEMDAERLLNSVRLRIATTDGQVLRTGIVPDATAVQVDPGTETIRVLATIENEDRVLRPGMDVRVYSDVETTGSVSQ